MTNKVEYILERIKQECPELMLLDEGCEIKSVDDDIFTLKAWLRDSETGGVWLCEYSAGAFLEMDTDYILKHYRIIGGNPKLEHLLRTLKNCETVLSLEMDYYVPRDTTFHLSLEVVGDSFGTIYDLTKSVEQNLRDNEELKDFIYSLFK